MSLLWIGLALLGFVVVAVLIGALATFIIKGVAIIDAARTPQHLDQRDYRLSQGHEVRSEETRQE